MLESDGLQSRYPDPNRPLTPAWTGSVGDGSGDTRGSFWTRGLRGRDRGARYQARWMHQARWMAPGTSLIKAIAIEAAMTLRAAVIWTLLGLAVGLGILYGLLGLIALAN